MTFQKVKRRSDDIEMIIETKVECDERLTQFMTESLPRKQNEN
jgi:hypothetical protein